VYYSNIVSFEAIVYNVMIASPGDIKDERDIAREVVLAWNNVHAVTRRTVLLPTGWDTHSAPAMDAIPQETINKQVLSDADLLVGIFWTRLGTATAGFASGTVEEIERHIASGRPVMLYFSDVPVHPSNVNIEQHSRLQEFRESVKARGLIETFGSPSEFRDKLSRQLQIKLNVDRHFAPIVPLFELTDAARRSEPTALSKEARELLVGGAKDKHGRIWRRPDVGGISLIANDERFFDHGGARDLARWDAALGELEERGLIQPDFAREIFQISHSGFALADELAIQSEWR
jgi:hypothetical protein